MQRQHVAGTDDRRIEQHPLIHNHQRIGTAGPQGIHHRFDVLLVDHVIVDIGGRAVVVDCVLPQRRIIQRYRYAAAAERGQHQAGIHIAGVLALVLCAVGAIGAIGLERVRKIGDLFGQIADVLLQLVGLVHALLHQIGRIVGGGNRTIDPHVGAQQKTGQGNDDEYRDTTP